MANEQHREKSAGGVLLLDCRDNFETFVFECGNVYENSVDFTLRCLRKEVIFVWNLADGKGTLGQLMSGDEMAFEDLEASLANIRSITDSINEGEGTLGRLVRDAKLYDETTLLVEDIRAAVDDLREASPITSFGSVLFGAF